ncbi:Hypothetical predicted protein [Cloeon dipterum]|uniref:Uncharacterized protein n=1 Tax=Cloeon dipterum TaxID=197152 RepID=A0A8S1DNZ7_9INSE|nr:Hypothetical predicted protein [Cloeon dipterum]
MFSKVMHLIESKSPKVESLTIDLKRITSGERPLKISLLQDLKNLKKLEMLGCNILLADLKFLCREKLPKLQHVEVSKIFISLSDLHNEENLVKSLSNLRVLLFQEKRLLMPSTDRYYFKYQTLFERLCIQRLPNLKVFQQMADHTAGKQSTVKFQIQDTIRERLQHLTTAQGFEGMHLMFPAITHLRVDEMNEEKDWRNLLQFPKIESLQICHSPSTAIEPFLVRYGANLQTLVLSEMEGARFHQILKLCPNLEVLKLQEVTVEDDTDLISDFAKLKRLYWKPADDFKEAHLSYILAAPDLETLELFGNSFKWEDIDYVSGLVSNRQILRKLVTFKYVGSRPQVPFRHNDDEEYTDFFLAMSKLVKNSMAFIPKLCDVSVFVCYGCISWHNIDEGRQIEDMAPDPSVCKCLTASVCKELKDEISFDFLEALKRQK